MSRDGWEAVAAIGVLHFIYSPAASSHGVSENNAIIYETRYLLDANGNPVETYLEANDKIVILKSDKTAVLSQMSIAGAVGSADGKLEIKAQNAGILAICLIPFPSDKFRSNLYR